MPRDAPFTFAFPSPAEAVAALLAQIRPVEDESIPLDRAAGGILAQSVTADRPSPAVDVSAMDGYAVRLSDLGSGDLPIAGEVRIGREPARLPAGACLRIVTGAPIPPGADAVIKREDTTEHADRIAFSPALAVQPGQNIRRTGDNAPAGAEIVQTGSLVTPAIAAALAACGVARPRMHRCISVAILTTGDEVVPVDHQPTPWQLRDSNAAALRTLVESLGCAKAHHRHIPDDPAQMTAAVSAALTSADAVLLTGGVSMGHRDYVTDALAACGVRTLFHGVPQRPGKPILAGITPDGRPVLGLPGNPVSVMVTARRFAVPALCVRAGCRADALPARVHPTLARLENSEAKPTDLWWHRPVRIKTLGHVEPVDHRSSGDVAGAARADGFIEVPPGQSGSGPWPFYSWGL